jgi:hypothetical protein
MSADLSGEISAVATTVLALFAILTAILAYLAFRKQSREVRAIEQQVTDQQEVTKQQGELIQIQSEQLAEQRKLNEEQITIFGLQAEELRESLNERKREAVERRRAQAAQVSIMLKVSGKSREGGPEIEATVTNASERQQPIYNVKLYWHRDRDGYGEPNPELIGTVLNWERETRRREFPPGTNPDNCGVILIFRDALRTDWIKTPDGSLVRANSDLALNLVRALAATYTKTK